MTQARPRNQVEQEIRETMGVVPGFFDRIPDNVLDHEWKLFRHYELDETLIPNKYKELIGIAVHSETKCRYCTLFHTEAARMFGATDEEIQEAVHYAKHTVGWSVYLNGVQQDYDEFAHDVEKIAEHMMATA
ncbi:MAG TPA: carboxymuconolactone decarboxylase family protein [Longimicrobiales bacterium]|nr:carboxymuconolactone decarboxylase family protein [Longimicrobiales bacterium]